MTNKGNKILLNSMIGTYLGLFYAFLIVNMFFIPTFMQAQTAQYIILFISWFIMFAVLVFIFVLLFLGKRYFAINMSAVNTTILLVDLLYLYLPLFSY